MFDRLRCALFATWFLVAAAPAHGASEISTSVVPLPNGTVATSLVRAVDGNFWFSDFDPISGSVGYLVRLGSGGTTTYYRMPNFTGLGVPNEPTIAIALVNAPAFLAYSGQTPQLIFNWLVYNPATQSANEAGLGTIDVYHPSQITEYAGQTSGDPLYGFSFTLEPFATTLVSSRWPPMIWSYAHTLVEANPPAELVAGVTLPLGLHPRFTAFQIHGETYIKCCAPDNLVAAPDGSIWYLTLGAIGRIDQTEARQFGLPVTPAAIAAGSANLWVRAEEVPGQAPPGVFEVDYAGSVKAYFAPPLLGFDSFLMAAAPNVLWSLSFDSVLGTAYFMRLDATTGQWSAYALPGLVSSIRPELTTLAIAPDGTLWGGIANPGPPPTRSALFSLRTSRVLGAEPVQLSLSSGQSALISVSETNYGGTIFAANVPKNCPLTVGRGTSPGTFVVTATSNVLETPCGVTFSDPDGISVWVPAALSAGTSVDAAWRGRMRDVSRRPRILGH